MVDNLYKLPPEVMQEVKSRLQNLKYPEPQKVEETVHIIAEIRDIGENAQHQRPDSMRLRGQRIAVPANLSFTAAISELDGRCKWLVGTLHLMVRKMKDSLNATQNDLDSVSLDKMDNEQIVHIQETVRNILGRVADLPNQVGQPRPDLVAAGEAPPEWVLFQARNAASSAGSLAESEEGRQWLEDVLTPIAMKELSHLAECDRPWNERVAHQITETGKHCYKLPAKIPKT